MISALCGCAVCRYGTVRTLTFVQDRPSDVVWPYTNSDVVVDDNGVGFRYSFSALKDRHTAVEVNYTRPAERLAGPPRNWWKTRSHTALRTQPAEDGPRSAVPAAVRPTVPDCG
ncbi:phage tail protein [Escherichia coli]|uniref:phage tail protein n=1 Tax=Escherichia coli TaxID=562 RepID=UPI0038902DC7